MNTNPLDGLNSPQPAVTSASLASTRRAFGARGGEADFSFDPIKFNALLARWGR